MGCHVQEVKTTEWKPCIFPFSRSDIPGKIFQKCIDVDPKAPDGRLMCSTNTTGGTNMHIDGQGYWGFCDDQHCPEIKGKETLEKRGPDFGLCQTFLLVSFDYSVFG